MSTENNYNPFLQSYDVPSSDVLSHTVGSCICVFIPRGVLVAAFNSQHELMTIHYSGYEKTQSVWNMEFLDKVLAEEPLLKDTDKVRGVFYFTEKNMIVPKSLYKDNLAQQWFCTAHFLEHDETLEACMLESDDAIYLYAIPAYLKKMVDVNFPNAVAYPLALYQFRNPPRIGLSLQSCITDDQVCCTLHLDGKLLWHRIFDYASAEDIVYEGKYLCRENNYFATKLTILFNSLTGSEFGILSEYSQYYPSVKSGQGNRIYSFWDAPAALAQQLISCVL
jgi:Protein of unknown function (DUF3822)